MLSRDDRGDLPDPDPYSSEEWNDISAAIEKISRGGLPDPMRARITEAAQWYRVYRDRYKEWQQGIERVKSKEHMAAWKAVAKALKQLQTALLAAQNPGVLLGHVELSSLMIDYSNAAAEALVERGDDERAHQLLLWKYDSDLRDKPCPIGRRDIKVLLGGGIGERLVREQELRNRIMLESIQNQIWRAEYESQPHRIGGARFKRMRQQDVFRIFFFRDLFRVWTDLGGKLEFSRHPTGPRKGEPQGPLIRFLRAATSPIMGEVKLETLAKAVKREKQMRAQLISIDRWRETSQTIVEARASGKPLNGLGSSQRHPNTTH